jgi:hypothetical protein
LTRQSVRRASSWARGTYSFAARDRPDHLSQRIGEGRAHVEFDGIHTFGPYDFEVDTTAGVDARTIASVLSAWQRRTPSAGVLAQSTENR